MLKMAFEQAKRFEQGEADSSMCEAQFERINPILTLAIYNYINARRITNACRIENEPADGKARRAC